MMYCLMLYTRQHIFMRDYFYRIDFVCDTCIMYFVCTCIKEYCQDQLLHCRFFQF